MMATVSDTMVAQNNSWTDGHNACPIMLDTGSPVRELVPMSPRRPHVAAHEGGQPVPPLLEDRVVEPELRALFGQHALRVALVAIAGERVDRDAYEPERDERSDEQHRNRPEHPAHQVPQHSVLQGSGRGSRESATGINRPECGRPYAAAFSGSR